MINAAFLSFIIMKGLSFRERIFLGINVPKGIDVAVIILLMITMFSDIPGLDFIVSLGLLFMLYSIVLSTVATSMSNLFFPKKKDS